MEIEEYDEKTIERIKTFERMFGESPTEEDIEILNSNVEEKQL